MNYLDGYGKENCEHCGLIRTEAGHDGCIGELQGVMNACCGYGDYRMAYIQFDHAEYKSDPNKCRIEGREALAYISEHSKMIKWRELQP